MLEFNKVVVEGGKSGNTEGEIVKWKVPPEGVYKLNTDAAMLAGNQVGMGGVVRDCMGDVVAAMCCQFEGGADVAIAEALCARKGLQLAMEAGYKSLILEVDNLKLFSYLTKDIRESSYFGLIVEDIQHLVMQCVSISFSHTKRKGNEVAHRLAKMCNTLDGMKVWLEDFPPKIASIVIADKMP